ncbi:hypothetical protein SODALDRAFT_359717 [Sodiomyces alkalinus F11]|uniref:Uncharacterized protein n=1 Tax=Sodiomyces alkalinus (strain CBS 110278 / VKM F-3762 / F11) TaxID=1314773 RepID=A0A3N2PVW2_SODAK|nr:hypothetical protein SODALDRAFT_359717 [Sodiomyces alkalinus F11]ROT38614.1 hypothetical protein SODALDRAFT_359717 [Sodiomyces alkalinus F11]
MTPDYASCFITPVELADLDDKMDTDGLPYETMDLDVQDATSHSHGLTTDAVEMTSPITGPKREHRSVTRQNRVGRSLTSSRLKPKWRRSLLMPDIIATAPPWSRINSTMTGHDGQVQETFRFVDNIIDSGEIGMGNASPALDIYRRSQTSESVSESAKRAKRRQRIARRWVDLTGGSLLLSKFCRHKSDTEERFKELFCSISLSINPSFLRAIATQRSSIKREWKPGPYFGGIGDAN